MAEITYNDLLSQLSPVEKDQFEGIGFGSSFLENYINNPTALSVTGHDNYAKFKPIAEAYKASETIPKGNFISNMFNFSSADAAMPEKYGLVNTDIALQMYSPDMQKTIFGDENYLGNKQTNNLPFTSMADMAAANKNFMDQFKTGEDFQMVGPLRGTNVMEGSVIPPDMNIRDYQYPMGTDIYSMDESVYDVQDAPYGIGPDGKPYKEPRTIADQKRVLGMTFTEPKQNLLEQILQNNLTANLLKGVGSFAGDFFKGLAPYKYGTSQRYHQNLSPQGKAIANQLYAPGGSLQGYNQISAWGGGPSASLGNRIKTIDKTLAKWEANPTKYADKLANTTLYDRRAKFQQEQNKLNTAGWNQGAKAKTQGTIQQLNPHEMRNVATTGDAGGNTGAKIVCTMMNERYGFGSFRNKIWMKFHESYGPEYQKGYHTIFLPLVKIAKGEGKLNTAVRKVLEHMGRHVTADMFKIMKGKKRDTLGRIYRAIFEPTCRIIGKIKSALGRG